MYDFALQTYQLKALWWISTPRGFAVFKRPVVFVLAETVSGWRAECPLLQAEGAGKTIPEAVASVVERIGMAAYYAHKGLLRAGDRTPDELSACFPQVLRHLSGLFAERPDAEPTG